MAQHEKSHERVDDVNVVNPTGDFTPGYKKSDMERIFHDSHPHSWQDLIGFIEKKGDSEWHITPGEAMSMKDDLTHLARNNVPFTSDPAKAFDEAHRFRGGDRPSERSAERQQRR